MPEFKLGLGKDGLSIGHLLKQSGLTASTSEAVRMIKQGAVKLDGEKVTDRETVFRKAGSFVVQVGKRKFARITLS